MQIKQSVINTFKRVGIDYQLMDHTDKSFISRNRFSGETCKTTSLIKFLIGWVYKINNDYEQGIQEVKISDFDRVRYFILDQDSNAYYICID